MDAENTNKWYDVFEVKGSIDYWIGKVQAKSALDALVHFAPPTNTVHGMRVFGEVCIVQFREHPNMEMRVWYARPGRPQSD